MTSKILIVDDDPSSRDVLESMLQNQNYDFAMARNGIEALQMASQSPPDLILLDVMMPGMDGFEVCRRVRANPELAEVPIIILTALDDRSAFLQGLEAGADDFLTKPVDRQELRARVRTIVRINRYRTLLEQRESLRQMAGHMVTAQEKERQTISRELHDDLGQSLTAHILNLRNLQGELPKEMVGLRRRIDILIAETNETLNKIRLLAHDLRPPVLDALGLQAAITTYCQEFGNRTHLPVDVEIDPAIGTLSDLYSVILYRVAQETLTNISKHADASHVWVELEQDENTLNLTIQDNGRGFSPEDTQTNGIGLLGMRERLALVGGNFHIRSKAGQGTVVAASLPLDQKEEA